MHTPFFDFKHLHAFPPHPDDDPARPRRGPPERLRLDPAPPGTPAPHVASDPPGRSDAPAPRPAPLFAPAPTASAQRGLLARWFGKTALAPAR